MQPHILVPEHCHQSGFMQSNGTLVVFSVDINAHKQQLAGAQKCTYTHLEEEVARQNQAGLVNRNTEKELCFCVTALL